MTPSQLIGKLKGTDRRQRAGEAKRKPRIGQGTSLPSFNTPQTPFGLEGFSTYLRCAMSPRLLAFTLEFKN